MSSFSSVTKAFKSDDTKKEVTIEEAEKAVAADRALCASNAITTTAEELLCSDLATKQRAVEKARDHENLARLHRDRRDLACSSTANSFEESDDFGWKQKDAFNRTEYESVWKSTGASGAEEPASPRRRAGAVKF